MKQISTHLYATYNRYADALRSIPWYNDVLKPVERRIIFSAYEVAKQYVKAVKIVGTAIVYHPHGDKSIYDSLVSLVNKGFLLGQGNYGSEGLHQTPPAAARYVEAKMNPDLSKLFSQYLQFVPWKVLEIEKEPLYLPASIPIGLIGTGVIQGIGGVNTTKIPRYKYTDLINRLLQILTNKKKETIIPEIRNCDVFEDSIGSFESILTTGKGIIQTIPNVVVKHTHITIYGKNPVTGFKKLLSFNEKYETKHKIPYFESVDLSRENKIEIQIIPRKGRVDQKFENTIMRLISTRVHIICNLVIEDLTVKLFSIDDVLLNCFNKWKDAWKSKLELDLKNLKIKKFELSIVQIVRQILNDHKNINTIKKIISIYETDTQYQNSKVTTDLIESICKKYSIEKLIETKINISEIETKIILVQKDIDNIFNLALQTLK